jgi:hypothetical protein
LSHESGSDNDGVFKDVFHDEAGDVTPMNKASFQKPTLKEACLVSGQAVD